MSVDYHILLIGTEDIWVGPDGKVQGRYESYD